MRFLMYVITALTLVAGTAFGYFADTDTEHQNFALGVIDNNGNSVISTTGVFPLQAVQGYGAFYAARQTDGETVTSQVYVGRVQGGFNAGPLKLRGYVEGSRDLIQLIDLRIEGGIFVESPSFVWQGIEFSAAGGNFMDRRDLDDEIGRDAADTSTTFGLLTFVTAEYKRLSSIVRFKPNLDLDDYATEIAVSWNEEIDDNIGVQVAGLWKYDTASVADSLWNRSIQFMLTYRPGD